MEGVVGVMSCGVQRFLFVICNCIVQVWINNINIDSCYAYSLICFPFQSAAIEPPQIDLVEYRPDVPGISDRRTGEPLLYCFANIIS
jgi:hypothetical protein